MLRRFRLLIALALLVPPGTLGLAALPATAHGAAPAAAQGAPPAAAQGAVVAAEDPSRGLIYRDLRRGRPDGPCPGLFEVETRVPGRSTRVSCTHGPDPTPPGVDARISSEPAPEPPGGAAAASELACPGNGTDGFRVEVLYARASDRPDRFAEYASSFVQWVGRVDAILDASARETGSTQHVRWVTDPSCNLTIGRPVLTPAGDNSFSATASELRAQGYDRTDRKYLVFVDAVVLCGTGELWPDDRASAVPGINRNNGHLGVDGLIARVDAGCWSQTTPAHEVMHTLGSVQQSAPHSTPGWHCTDESDRMCYDDDGAGGVSTQQVCPLTHEERFDCNHDDYYHPTPTTGSYLDTHWNTARSGFLTPPTPPVASDAVADFDGNGTTDLSVWRPSEGTWYVRNGAAALWGTSGDIPVPGDYDGNGTTDMAVWRPSVGVWYVRNGVTAAFGASGDIPVPADYDGNGTTDMAVLRPSTGVWYVRNGVNAAFGAGGDIPVPADYDGNGVDEIAVFRPSTGVWYVRNSVTAAFGASGDIPVPADYDGNGVDEIAVFRPSQGAWYVRNGAVVAWGVSGDIPVPGDYDGNNIVDVAIWRPSDGSWSVRNGTLAAWGASGDIPTPLPSAIRQFFP